MSIGINDLDWDDDVINDDISDSQEPEYSESWDDENNNVHDSEEPQEKVEEDLIIRMLSSRGISDPSKIKFENETGEIEEVSWDSLTIDEQFNILNQQDEPETGLDDAEIDLINKIREAKLTPQEYEAYLIRQGSESREEPEQQTYIIDNLSDDELYMYDLQARNEDITEEEALDALEKAKLSDAAFSKQIKGIREEYKKLEDERNQAQQRNEAEKRQEQFNQFSDSVRNSIKSFKNIGNLDIELDNDEMDEIAQFLLTTDGAGINHFSKVLNNPEWLVKMAWFALKGEDAFNDITNYFTAEMKQREQASYKKGLEDAKNQKNPKSKVVYQPNKNNKPEDRNYYTVDDLD